MTPEEIRLEIQRCNSVEELDKAYRRLAKKCHPDAPSGSHDLFMVLINAKGKREQYLKDSFGGNASPGSPQGSNKKANVATGQSSNKKNNKNSSSKQPHSTSQTYGNAKGGSGGSANQNYHNHVNSSSTGNSQDYQSYWRPSSDMCGNTPHKTRARSYKAYYTRRELKRMQIRYARSAKERKEHEEYRKRWKEFARENNIYTKFRKLFDVNLNAHTGNTTDYQFNTFSQNNLGQSAEKYHGATDNNEGHYYILPTDSGYELHLVKKLSKDKMKKIHNEVIKNGGLYIKSRGCWTMSNYPTAAILELIDKGAYSGGHKATSYPEKAG